MKKAFFILLLLCITISSFSQSEVMKMNVIKSDTNYIYSSFRAANIELAREGARSQLEIELELYIESMKHLKNSKAVIINEIVSNAEEIQMRRGTVYRVFLFVKKSNVFPANISKPHLKSMSLNNRDSLSVLSVKEDSSNNLSWHFKKKWQQSIVLDLMKCKTIYDACENLDRYSAENKIKRFGIPKDCEDSSICFWLIRLREDSTILILSPGVSQRYNFKTQQTDSLSNYSGQDAVWFLM